MSSWTSGVSDSDPRVADVPDEDELAEPEAAGNEADERTGDGPPPPRLR